jgi:hypothetical protein
VLATARVAADPIEQPDQQRERGQPEQRDHSASSAAM